MTHSLYGLPMGLIPLIGKFFVLFDKRKFQAYVKRNFAYHLLYIRDAEKQLSQVKIDHSCS
jgi:hypothetical protein